VFSEFPSGCEIPSILLVVLTRLTFMLSIDPKQDAGSPLAKVFGGHSLD
jgi:hypothetical protein